MSGRGQIPPQFSQWLVALRDGTILEHDFAHLSTLLESDADARRYYVEYMQLAAILCKRPATGAATAEAAPRLGFLEQVVAAGRAVAVESTQRVLAQGAAVLARPRSLALVVASVATASLVIVLASLHMPRFAGESAAPAIEQAVANVSRVHEPHWANGTPHPFRGQGLTAGSQLVLQSGFVEIAFDRGASVVLEGPAALAISGDNSLVLDGGRLSALVPESARGFTVTSPTARLIDLGTEFGVSVNEKKDTEVFVFQGRVAAEVLDREGHIVQRDELMAGQACRFGRQGLVASVDKTEAKQCGARFVRKLPERKTRMIAEVRTSAGYRYPVVRRLQEGSLAYTDRPNHRWSGIDPDSIPAFLAGAEYVAPANDDKGYQFEVTVTLVRPVVLYLLFDDRAEVPDWLKRDFVDTGEDIGMNEEAQLVEATAAGDKPKWTGNDRPFSIFERVVSQPGTITLDAANVSGTNMYVLAAVPLEEGNASRPEEGSRGERQ